jgi:hypothetical protein
MNTNVLVEIQARLHRLERQNRILIMLFFAIAGVASIAATNHSGSVITAGEVRTPHLTLVDNHGKPLVETQGVDGVEVRSYLPHNVVQR